MSETEYIDFLDTNFKFSELRFTRSKNVTGMRYIKVYHNNKAIGFKFPKLRVPFNLKVDQFNKMEIHVSLNDALCDRFKQLDHAMIDFALENKWFQGGDEFEYVSNVKEGGKFPSTFRFKIHNRDERITTVFFDEEGVNMNLNTYDDVIKVIEKGTNIYIAIDMIGVWFNKSANNIDRYGITWKADHIMVLPEVKEPEYEDIPQEEVEYAFDSDTDSSTDSIVKYLVENE